MWNSEYDAKDKEGSRPVPLEVSWEMTRFQKEMTVSPYKG
jgi:hypothetical protein